MIFSLTDETYALLSSAKVPQGVKEHDYYFAVALLDQSYWVLGSVIGSLLGAALGFDTTGVDFAMDRPIPGHRRGPMEDRRAAICLLCWGGAATLVSLLAVGAEEMLLPALGIMVAVLVLLRPTLEEQGRRRPAAVREEGAR